MAVAMYLINVEQTGRKNFAAIVPALPACRVIAPTLEQAISAAKATIEDHLKVLAESGKAIPAEPAAMSPVTRGFGYVVLESPVMLVDWGVKATRTDKEKATQRKVASLIENYTPNALILPRANEKGTRRSQRVVHLISTLRTLALSKGVRVHFISKTRLSKHFGALGAETREEIAGKIAEQFPDLKPWLPRHRKPWMPDDYHMAVFQAAALGVTPAVAKAG